MLNLSNSLSSHSQNFKFSLLIHCKTWSRDSHGLFDYECTLTKNNSFQIKKEQLLIRNKNDLRLENNITSYTVEDEEECLGKLYQDKTSKI